MDKPLAELTLNDLKAMAYDQITLLERCQQNLQIINAEIKKRQEQEQSDNLEDK
jgi:hypothetical protein